jgi:hypothetical protein
MVKQIKWVGEPSILHADGFKVGNWKHENRRTVALMGNATRTLNHRKFPGLSRTYRWGGNPETGKPTMQDIIQPVLDADWELIHKHFPFEFKDVTDHPNPELVENDPIIVRQDPATGKWVRSR